MPVVWRYNSDRVGDRIGSRLIDDSTFVVMSSYWALNPNALYGIAADARQCVEPDDRWMLVAESPGFADVDSRWTVPDDPEPVPVDERLWDRVTANPWRLISQGPAGEPGESPYYQGVAKFTDQTVVTSAACDTRINRVQFLGDMLAPREWPESLGTMVCVPPPGVEWLMPQDRVSEWYLPIGGTLAFDGDELIITHNGVEYRWAAISDEEFAADFDRDSFYPVEDPLHPLDVWVLDSFAIFDNPPDPNAPDLTTTEAP